jgi:ligand-binding sensor domain-containing protein
LLCHLKGKLRKLLSDMGQRGPCAAMIVARQPDAAGVKNGRCATIATFMRAVKRAARVAALLIGVLSIGHAEPISLLQMARHFRVPIPGAELRAIAADADNYLWLATPRGLIRFDGQHFDKVLDRAVETVAVTADGWVWTGGTEGLFAVRRGAVRHMLTQPVTSIVARGREIVVGNTGRLWRGSIQSLSQMDIQANGLLALDRDQRVWFGCGTEVCALSVSGVVERTGEGQGLPSGAWLSAISADDGTILAQRELEQNRLELVFVRPGRPAVRSERGAPTLPADRVMFRTHDGKVWCGLGWIEQLRVATARQTQQGMFGISHAEDRAGNHWMGTLERDLYVLSNQHWVNAWKAPQFPINPKQTLRTKSGKLLVSSQRGLIEFDADLDKWRRLPGELSAGNVGSVVESSAGGLWVIFPDQGICRVNVAGAMVQNIFQGPITAISFRRLVKDRDGHIWVCAKQKFFRIDESVPRLVEVLLPGGGRNAVTFASGLDGQEWLGYEGGIAKREGTEWRLVVPSAELADPRIRSIAVGPGPEFWVSYRRSLPISLIRSEGGKWKRRDLPAGDADALGLLRDRRGWIWIGTDSGLLVSDGVHVEAEDWVTLDENHNLPSKSIALDGLMEDFDGSIVVATERGLARVDPDPAWFAPSQERCRVTAVRWPGGGRDSWPLAGMRRPAGLRGLEIDFARWPSAVPSRGDIQYRLTPIEPDWKSGPQGIARYDVLAAGGYVFEMKGRDGDPASSFRFEIESQSSLLTWWLCAGGAAGLWGTWLWWNRTRANSLRTQYWAAKNAFLATRNSDQGSGNSIGDVLSGRYTIETPIGHGGFSTVFRARDTENGSLVAVKCFHDIGDLQEWQRRRFEKETSALRRLSYPGLVRLLDSGWISERQPFLVMDLIEGPTLRDVLRSGPIGRKRAKRWIVEIGEALEAAHREGVLHRDLKPENILIPDANGPSEHIVLVDFGAATIREAGIHEVSSFALASFGYMAPERILGRSSPATDVYSLATVAYELLTGARFSNLADPSPAGLRKALAEFSVDVLILLAAGLAYVPEYRPQKAGEYARELARGIGEY